MDVISAFLANLAGNTAIQTAVMGLVVKVVVDFLKQKFVDLDADGTKVYKVPVQLLVVLCSAFAGAGDLYLKSQLATIDPSVIINFLTVTLPVYLNAMGIHLLHTHVKEKGK